MSVPISPAQMAALVANDPTVDATRARRLQEGSAVLHVLPAAGETRGKLDFCTAAASGSEDPFVVRVWRSHSDLAGALAGSGATPPQSPEGAGAPSLLDQVVAHMGLRDRGSSSAPSSALDAAVAHMGLA